MKQLEKTKTIKTIGRRELGLGHVNYKRESRCSFGLFGDHGKPTSPICNKTPHFNV